MNKKGLVGFAKYSILVLAFAAIISFAVLNLGAVFAVDTVTISVSPNFTGNQSSQTILFNVTVDNTIPTPDNISEFRIEYQKGGFQQFTNVACLSKVGWNGPYYINITGDGTACLYIASDESNEIHGGESDFFQFTANPPGTECCRNLTFEVRGAGFDWLPKIAPICVDPVPPLTTKTYGDPSFTNGSSEWITSSTLITLTAVDTVGKHDTGIDKTWWYDQIVNDSLCYDDALCQNWSDCPTPYNSCFCNPENGPQCVENAQKICKSIPAVCEQYAQTLGYASYNDCIGNITSWEDCVEEVVNSVPPSERNPNAIGCVSCACQENWQLYQRTGPFQKPTESCHIIQFFSVDGIGNIETLKKQCVFVDNTPPVGIKQVGEPNIPITENVEEVGKGTVEWSTEQAKTGTHSAKLYVEDGTKDWAGIDIPVDIPLDQINSLAFWELIKQYNPNGWSVNVILGVDSDGDGTFESDIAAWHVPQPGHSAAVLGDDTFIEMDGVSGNPPTGVWAQTDAYNTKQWWTPNATGDGLSSDCYQTLGNFFACSDMKPNLQPTDHVKLIKLEIGGSGSWNNEIAFVDGLSLNGKVILDEPKNWWVTNNTPITLSCEDQQPHPVDHNKVCYRITVDDATPGEFTCVDSPKVIKFTEDSNHQLDFYCKDALGNTGSIDSEKFKVDTTPPSITKTMIGTDHLGECPPGPEPNEPCYVRDNRENGVHIAVQDGGEICAVDQTTCQYELWWKTELQTCINKFEGTHLYNPDTGKCFVEGGSFGENGQNIIFGEDSTHTLIVNCQDALGNAMKTDIEEFLVDSTPPVTTKTIGQPLVKEGFVEWINFSTPITLSAEDAKVGVDKTWYKDRVLTGEQALACANPEEFCKPNLLQNCEYCQSGNYPAGCLDQQQTYCSGLYTPKTADWYNCVQTESQAHCCGGWDWTLYRDTPIFKTEESCHVLYYFSVDKLGNVEPINVNCFYVENTPPKTTKDIGDPKVVKDDKTYISQQTPITLRCAEQGPHSTGKTAIKYRFKFATECSGLPEATWSGWLTYNDEIHFTEDSCHQLEYYCEDALGNKEQTQSEIDIVDTKPPVITKTIVGPYSGDCPPIPIIEDGEKDFVADGVVQKCYIDGVTKIHVEAEDQEPHPVDQVTCDWSYIVIGNESAHGGARLVTPPFDINFPEESEHVLTITCRDSLGNDVSESEVFFVDKTPPETRKEYGQPFYSNGSADWITSQTNISLFAYDAGPHKSGVKEINWKVSLVDDKYCYNADLCQQAQPEVDKEFDKASPKLMGDYIYGPVIFTIPQDSCHLIEYYSVDNVNKTETVKKQCVFVDNKAPVPNKTVGDPKTMWDGKDSIFYPWIKDKCWNGQGDQIDCWKVTMDTPISLECIDQEPHPVDHNSVCFKVELDGDDSTEKYCSEQGAVFNGTGDGFCCLKEEKQNFVFREETEHNLKYYCLDALGNKGPIDEEKFKVGGTKFTIPLNKKWNLISVPFVLINDNPNEVFNETPGVMSVWAYDSENSQWLVFTPGNGPDTLTSIEPGWGYWVLENNSNECLTIGGSLFNPKEVPPSRNLVKGWNLIGFYGTMWQEFNRQEGCSADVFGEKVYCSLNSLIDTQQGYPRWSSLWTYKNEGDHNTWWEPLSTCAFRDTMFAGRGYWIELDVNDMYAPATTCIWNSDFKCIDFAVS